MRLIAVGWIVRDNQGEIRAMRTKHKPDVRTFDEAWPDQAPHVLKELFEKVGVEEAPTRESLPTPPNRKRPSSIFNKIRAMGRSV